MLLRDAVAGLEGPLRRLDEGTRGIPRVRDVLRGGGVEEVLLIIRDIITIFLKCYVTKRSRGER